MGPQVSQGRQLHPPGGFVKFQGQNVKQPFLNLCSLLEAETELKWRLLTEGKIIIGFSYYMWALLRQGCST